MENFNVISTRITRRALSYTPGNSITVKSFRSLNVSSRKSRRKLYVTRHNGCGELEVEEEGGGGRT